MQDVPDAGTPKGVSHAAGTDGRGVKGKEAKSIPYWEVRSRSTLGPRGKQGSQRSSPVDSGKL